MKKTAVLLGLPLAALCVWTGILAFERTHGTLVEIAVEGYDPRDLLAGHYLRLQTNYGVDCPFYGRAYLCLDEKRSVSRKPLDGCSLFIAGECYGNRFRDGVGRFYVPENRAVLLERALANKKLSPTLVLSVLKNGEASPVDLKIDGKPWAEWVKEQDIK